MDNKSTTKRMIGAVVLVLVAALLLAWLLKGKNRSNQEQELVANQVQQGEQSQAILGFPGVNEGETEAMAEAETEAPIVLDGAQTATTDAGSNAVTDTVEAGQQAIANAVDAGSEAVQNLANNMEGTDTTGLEVRASQGETRQVVENGVVTEGSGSMGASETSTSQTTQTAATATETPTQTAETTETAQVSESSSENENVASRPLQIPPPRLVDERPVPPPRVQTARTTQQQQRASSESSSATSERVVTAPPARSTSSSTSAPTATASQGYVIQVLAASSRKKAENVRQSISVDGYPTFVAQANVNGKTVYRVRIGTYPQRSAALAVQNKMKARYTKNRYVQNSFVTRN